MRTIRKMKKIRLAILMLILIGVPLIYVYKRSFWVPINQRIFGKQTVSDILEKYGQPSENRLKPYFISAGVIYPPESITLLGIKDEKRLELWAGTKKTKKFIREYPVKGASGVLGPKLEEGDKQIPEGIYKIERLNPNSSYHLSLKLDYPNEFDLINAKAEGRNKPGSNIFIHGKAVSIGCLAMGDETIEELFTLVATIGKQNATVIITPSDPRKKDILPLAAGKPNWVGVLYKEITKMFSQYKQ